MIIFIVGLPGTGKTYFAKALAEKLNAIHINSDQVRIEMNLKGQYDVESRMLVYDEMRSRMSEELAAGKNVVIDATFYSSGIRKMFFEATGMTEQYIVLMTANDDTILKRTTVQRPDSDAKYETYLNQKKIFEPLIEEHLLLASDQFPLDEMIKKTFMHFNLKE